MFTGLIEGVGTIREIGSRGDYRVLTIASEIASEPLVLGESVACDGACLTVVKTESGSFAVEASAETAARTILANYRTGSVLNLERAMKLGDRMGGHMVSGHIDVVGKVDYARPVGESLEVAVAYDAEFDHLVVEKGSVALNGLSLTVNAVRSGWLSVNLIPHTVSATTIGDLKSGDRINIEFDLIGKYIARMQQGASGGRLTKKKLTDSGW